MYAWGTSEIVGAGQSRVGVPDWREMGEQGSVLILGSSGWIGHYLVPVLVDAGVSVIAAYTTKVPEFEKAPRLVVPISFAESSRLEGMQFDTIVNLSRGETEEDFQFHRFLVDLTNSRSGRYLYASSFNAVDQDVNRSHVESDQPGSQTDYGKFKARCEIEMVQRCERPVVLRFGGVHGWAPNRVARTEEFMKQLANGDPVSIYGGLLQNRIFSGELARQIMMLVMDEDAQDVFHLGASDFSEELDFHRKLASAFGYDPGQVVPGKAINWNAIMLMQRFMGRYPNFRVPTEADTIMAVRGQPQFAKYVCRSSSKKRS